MKLTLLPCVMLVLALPASAVALRPPQALAQDQTDPQSDEVKRLEQELEEQRATSSQTQTELAALQSELNVVQAGVEAVEQSRLRRLQLLEDTRRTFENMLQTLQGGSSDLKDSFALVRGNLDQVAQEANQFGGVAEAESEVKAMTFVNMAAEALGREDLRQTEDALALAHFHVQQARNFAGSLRAAIP